jgi:hypothetical protein
MINSPLMNEDPSIHEHLYQLSMQLKHPLDRVEIDEL